jgi:hypothetical protein
MLAAPEHLQPQQIAVELHAHANTFMRPITYMGRYKTPAELTVLLSTLHGSGYMLLDRHDNPLCKFCTEILLGKVQCMVA